MEDNNANKVVQKEANATKIDNNSAANELIHRNTKLWLMLRIKMAWSGRVRCRLLYAAYVIKNDLSKRLGAVKGSSFQGGDLRCTYVNPGDVKWKTTLFGTQVEEVHSVLKQLCYLINSKYDRNQLTVTTTRKNVSKNYEAVNARLKLHKITLLIKDSKKPEELFYGLEQSMNIVQ